MASADKLLAQITRAQWARFEKGGFKQKMSDLIDSTDSTEIIQNASEQVDNRLAQVDERNERQRSRFGLSNQTNRLAELDKSLTKANTINNARQDQYETNEMLKQDVINLGQQVSGQAQGAAANAAQSASARKTAYKNQSSQWRSSMWQTGASAASSAMNAVMFGL